MPTETNKKLLEMIDAIPASMGLGDFERFRTTMGMAAISLTNLAKYCERASALSRQDVKGLIDGAPEAQQQRALRLISELVNYLPTIGRLLTNIARSLPQAKGGHPRKLKDRKSERQACDLVLFLIERGHSEAEATKLAARHLNASARTINRTWKRRVELKEEPSIEEFLNRFITTLSAMQPSQSTVSIVNQTADTKLEPTLDPRSKDESEENDKLSM